MGGGVCVVLRGSGMVGVVVVVAVVAAVMVGRCE